MLLTPVSWPGEFHGVTKSQTQLSKRLTIMIVWGNKLEAFHLFQCSESVCLINKRLSHQGLVQFTFKILVCKEG